MTKIDQISEGVFQATDATGLMMLWGETEWLVNVARSTAKKRARVCFHQTDDAMHQMLIVLMRDTVVDAHSHNGCESQWLLTGHGYIEAGGILHPFDALNPFYFARPGVMHRPIVNSEYMIVLETKERE